MKTNYFILCLLILLSFNCGDMESKSPPSPREGEIPDQESWGSRIIISDKGITKAIIQAGHIKKFEKSGVTEIDGGVKIDFFTEDGSHSSLLTCERGTVEEDTKDVKTFGGVVIISDRGDTLEAEELRWDNKKGKVYADGHVRISTKDGVETGVGFESEPDLKRWTMKSVSGRLRR